MPKGQKRTPVQIISIERQVWELQMAGKTQLQIEALIGVDQVTVSRILKRLRARAEQELTQMVVAVKLDHFARLNQMAIEAEEAWQKSKTPRKTASRRVVSPGAGANAPGREGTTNRAEDRYGETRYLAEARAAMADARKIIGANAPDTLITDTASNWKQAVSDALAGIEDEDEDEDGDLE